MRQYRAAIILVAVAFGIMLATVAILIPGQAEACHTVTVHAPGRAHTMWQCSP